MDANRIAELRKMFEATTQGEWSSEGAGDSYAIRAPTPESPTALQAVMLAHNWTNGADSAAANAKFAADAHNAFEELLDEIVNLQGLTEPIKGFWEYPEGYFNSRMQL